MAFKPSATLYAHRGAQYEYPENTLEAFGQAVDLGVDAIETDIHMSRDGQLVIAHDPDGRRLAGHDRQIGDCTLAELKKWTLQGASRSARIPTFEDALSEFPEVVFNVDLKQRHPSMVEKFVQLVRRHDAEDRVQAASFHWRVMWALRQAAYRGRLCLSQAEVLHVWATPRSLLRPCRWLGHAAQIPRHVGPIRLDTQRFIARCARARVQVDYWTIDDPSEARRLLQLGADGIMTDDPKAILPVFTELRGQA